MPQHITAQQLFEHLAPYDLHRVTFQMPDRLPIIAATIDTDGSGGALITFSDCAQEPSDE